MNAKPAMDSRHTTTFVQALRGRLAWMSFLTVLFLDLVHLPLIYLHERGWLSTSS